jgi:hypothetical protein
MTKEESSAGDAIALLEGRGGGALARSPASFVERLRRRLDVEDKVVVGTLVLAVVASFSVTALVFHFTGDMGPDSGARFLMVRSRAEGGGLLFLGAGHDGLARVTDPFAGYMVHVPRGSCTVYPALFPAITGMLFGLVGAPGFTLVPLVSGLVAAWACYRAAVTWALPWRRWVPASVLFGSPLLLYSSTYWDHATIMALVGLATWGVTRAFARDEPRAAWLAGLTLGVGVWVHELVFLAGACLGVALVLSSRRLALRYALGFAPAACAWATFNAFVYGAMRGPHLMGPLDPTDPFKLAKLTDDQALLERLSTQIGGGSSALAWMLVIFAVVVPVASRFSRHVAAAFAVLASVTAVIQLLDPPPSTGLFQVTPWLLFAFIGPGRSGAERTWSDRVHEVLTRCSLLFLVLVVATPIVPGLNWGSRYMLTVLPMLALLALRSAQQLFDSLDRGPAVARVTAFATLFGIVALLTTVRSLRFYKAKVGFDDAHASTLARVSTPTTATDLWWLGPESVTRSFSTRLAMIVHIPASQQLDPLPPPPERDIAVRHQFFAELLGTGETAFTFVGTEGGRAALAARSREFGFAQSEYHKEADLIVARFEASLP